MFLISWHTAIFEVFIIGRGFGSRMVDQELKILKGLKPKTFHRSLKAVSGNGPFVINHDDRKFRRSLHTIVFQPVPPSTTSYVALFFADQ
jgi:hypothetical protein